MKGFARFNGDNGVLQIDDEHPVYGLSRKGREWSNRTVMRGAHVISFYTSENEMLFVRGERCVLLLGVSTENGVTEHVYETRDGGFIDYWVYAPGGVQYPQPLGLRIYAEDGRKVYDAMAKTLRVVAARMKWRKEDITSNLRGGQIAVCVTRLSGNFGSDDFIHPLGYFSNGDGSLRADTTPSYQFLQTGDTPMEGVHSAVFADVTNH